MAGKIRSVGAKIDKALHDAAADVASRIGLPLRGTAATELARNNLALSESDSTRWLNPLEGQFYGDSARPETVTHPATSLLQFENVFVTGSEALIFADFYNRIIPDESQGRILSRKARRPIRCLARREDGPVFPMGGRGTGNRGHFLAEHLPRLMLARGSGQCPLNLRLLLTPGHESWQSEYLSLLGETLESLLPGSHGSILCETLLTVPSLSEGSAAELYKPAVYADIRRRFLASCPDTARTRRQVFISRSDATSRRLSNEPEVYAACREFWPNLELVTLSGMSLAKQVDLMRGTDVVVGPHGQSFHLNLFLTDALSIQLVPGERNETNEYLTWAANYERLGLVAGNRCISFFSGPNVTDEDWLYPINELRKHLGRLQKLTGEPK